MNETVEFLVLGDYQYDHFDHYVFRLYSQYSFQRVQPEQTHFQYVCMVDCLRLSYSVR